MRNLKLVLLAAACVPAVQGEIPSWVREFATTAHPKYPASTKAVVLLNEEKVSVDASGKRATQVRKVIKVLTAEGRSEAAGMIFYDESGSKIREARGYLLHADGKTREYARKDFVEATAKPSYSLYSSQKLLILRAADSADAGSVFAYEFTFDEQKVFSQFWFEFQDDLPAVLSRFQLTVPSGWTAEAKAFNGASAQAQVNGDTYTWEARGLKPFEREPAAPGMWSQLPRIGVSMRPVGAAQTGPLVAFTSWRDVSVWKCKLSDPQAEVTAAVEAKVKELTAGKPGGPASLESIRAMAEFAQKIRYVSISTNLSRGGGYVPHTADAVLKAAYGDCKDKSNLLRAMLKSAGVESYMVSIYSGNPRFTQEEFPSPSQFNHAILAIRVPDAVTLPAVLTHPEAGRLLLFDPTDAYVPFGFIPVHEQNSRALLMAGEKGGLIRAPVTSPSQNHVDRRWTMELQPNGGLNGKLEETATGQEAFDNREELESRSKDGFRKRLEAWISSAVPGAKVASIEAAFDPATNSFRTALAFEAADYAKIMAGRLWMVRSAPMPFNSTPNVNKPTREQPLILHAASFSETVDWTMPNGLALDETPDQVELQGSFGKFHVAWKQQGRDKVRVERVLTLEEQLLPASEYKKVRDFFLKFHGAEAAPIVLAATAR